MTLNEDSRNSSCPLPIMKRIFSSLALACLAMVSSLSLSSAESLWFGGAGLEVQDVYSPSNDPIELRVTFWQSVNVSSLDSQDLWVVSQNGFQQLATFVRVERGTNVFPEPEVLEDRLIAEDPFRIAPTVAVYHVLPEVAEGWNESDNGRYVVLIEPKQIEFVGGGAMQAAYLGDFQIGIGQPRPAIPEEVEMKIAQNDDGTFTVHVVYHYSQGPVQVIEWGEPEQEGNRFDIHFAAVYPSDAFTDAPVVLEREYPLPLVKPGTYLVYLHYGDQQVVQRFAVREDLPDEIPASAELTIKREDERVLGHVAVTIEPNADGSIYNIGSWVEPRQDGNTIYLDATSKGPLESFNTEPYHAEHEYLLHGDEDDDGEGRPIKFKTLDLIPSYLRPTKRTELVFRTEEEWSNWVRDNWPPHIRAALPPIPVDFENNIVLAVFAGETEQGIDIAITAVTDCGSSIVADHLTSYPGIQLEDPELVRPGHMVAIPKTQLPVRFRGNTIAFPSPPPIELFDIAAQELDEGHYRVVFRIDGVAYAKGEFTVDDDGDRFPARAAIEVREGNDGAMSALVEVAFTGFPYHTVNDWGPVIRQGNHFILDAEASEVNFVQEPELPYFESHIYPLTLFGGSEEIDFKRLDLRVQKEQPQNVVIQTTQEWWDLTGFEPGLLALPAPDPVNFDEVTLIAVFAGAKPNGCHNVGIQEVALDNGVINVSYRERLPDPRELCTQAIVYPASAIAIEKTDTPIDFIEKPAQIGGDVNGHGENGDEAIPVDGPPGDGSAAGPLPEGDPLIASPPILPRGTLYTIEFRMNGVTYASKRFYGNDVIVIPNPGPLPVPFVDWLDRFLPQLPAEGALGADGTRRLDENQDGDRWTNFDEFLLGLDPTNGSEPSAIWTEWVTGDDGAEHFAICFKRRKDAGDMADFIVEVSRDLENWSHFPELVLEPVIRTIDGDLEEVMIGLAPDATAEGFPFARLRVNYK